MIRPSIIAALAAIGIWLAWPAGDHTGDSPPARASVPIATPSPAPVPKVAFVPTPAVLMPSGAASLAATHRFGDPEAPPIAREDPAREAPTQQELADPSAYQAYEARQSARLYASYVKAVDAELPILRDDIARGRALGIAPEKIAKAEDKVRRLEQMRIQLLKEHPQLAR